MTSHILARRLPVAVTGMVALLFVVGGLLGVFVPAHVHAAPPASPQRVAHTQVDPPKVEDPNTVGWQVWRMLDPDVRAKVNPRLLDEFQGKVIPTHLGGADVAGLPSLPLAQTRFLVYLRAQPDLSALETQVFASAADRRTAAVDLLRASTAASQAPVRAVLDEQVSAAMASGYQPFYITNVIAVEGNLLALIELAQRDDVAFIDANYPLVPMWEPQAFGPQPAAQDAPDALSPDNWNIDLVDADRVWQELGIRGRGAVVAGFDTGVTFEHPALREAYRGLLANGDYDHNYNWFEPDGRLYPNGDLGESLSDTPYDCDYWGTHGTHTMGTMVGDGGLPGTQVGMAPAARWIAVPGICFGTMSGFRGDDIGGIKAFQWLLCPTDLSGDPNSADCSKAPDVINNSWGSANPTSEIFRPIIQTLRQAGVAAVFASGNPSAGPGSIGSPASIPEGITVGATDASDEVTYFSGQGPSFYPGEQKPELSAPGLYVRSSIGSSWSDYGEGSGTSMAAPHVAGLIALLVSADLADGTRDFSVDELERFMTYTAVDLGEPGPDGEYGYGRIDALAAVRWAVSAGDLTGAVRATGSGTPVANATITGTRAGSNDRFTATAGTSGLYSTTVPGGVYNVDVTAWGHVGATFAGQQVFGSTQSVIDFQLQALSTAAVSGTVNGPAGPVAGARITVDGAPADVAATTGDDGAFGLVLPVGSHVLVVEAEGHRRAIQSVEVTDAGAAPGITLDAAPRILLVDAEARYGWFFGWPVHAFFSQALDARGYLHDFWPVQYTRFEDREAVEDGTIAYGTPSLATLQAYDVIIWTHGGCYDGYYGCIRAMGDTVYDALMAYLDGGGKIVFSGQDLARTEDGYPLMDDYMFADFISNAMAAEGDAISGAAFLSDMELTVTNAAVYGHANGMYYLSPDSVSPQRENGADDTARAGLSYPILSYGQGGGAAALASVSCDADYRTVLFALGLENVGPRAGEGAQEFAEVLERSVNWLLSPRPAIAVQSSLDTVWAQVSRGERADFTLFLANEGTETANVQITLTGNAWPTVLRVDGAIVEGSVVVPPCAQVSVTIEVTPPPAVVNGSTDQTTVTLSGVDGSDRSYMIETLFHVDWEYETVAPDNRWNPVLAAQPDDIYVYLIGGYGADPNYPEYPDYRPSNTVTRYNSCMRTWETVPPMPIPLTYAATAALNGKIYVMGGNTRNQSPWGFDYTVPSEKVMVFDPATASWSFLAPLPQPISNGAAAGVGDKIYFFGGDDWIRALDSVLVYDTTADSWSTLSTIPDGGRAYFSAAAIGERIYLTDNQEDSRIIDVFDTATGTWSQTSPMHHTRYDISAVGTLSGYLYIMGGFDDFGFNPLPAERYDPRTDQWQLVSAPNQSSYQDRATYAEGRVFYFSDELESLAVDTSFCNSTVTTSSNFALPNGTITYSWNIFHSAHNIPAVGIQHTLPPELSFVDFTDPPAGAVYDDEQRTIRWTGSLPASGAPILVTYTTKVGSLADFPWQTGEKIDSVVRFAAEGFPRPGEVVGFVREQVFTILLPDFEPSAKHASGPEALSGVPFTYTVDLLSTNAAGDVVRIVDTLPENLTMVPGTLAATTGEATYDEASRTVAWTGEVKSPNADITRANGSYIWGDSNGDGDVPDVEFSWTDIRQSGAYVGSGDDFYICDLPIGFTFPFYDKSHERFCVSSNGWVNFGGTTSSDYFNVCPLNVPVMTSPKIAAIWDDLIVFDGIYYITLGTEPNRRLVVQWQDAIAYSTIGFDTSTFQLVLYEDGTVDFNILDAGDMDGTSSSTGIEGTSENPSVTYACGTRNSIHDDLTVRYVPPTVGGDPARAAVRFQAIAGELDINRRVTNAVRIETSTNTYTRTVTTLFNSLSLGSSTLSSAAREIEPDDAVTFTAVLRNAGLKTAENATLSGAIPAELNVIPGSVSCSVGTCELTDGELIWRGPVAHADPSVVEFQARLVSALTDGSQIPVALDLRDGHGGEFAIATTLTVRRSDLARSALVLQPRFVEPGGRAVLTIFVQNSGHRPTDAQLEIAGLESSDFTVGVPSCSAGTCVLDDNNVLTWNGAVAPRSLVQIRLPVEFSEGNAYGTSFPFNAVVTDARWSEQFTVTDSVMIAHNLFMPSLQTAGPEPGHLYLPLIR